MFFRLAGILLFCAIIAACDLIFPRCPDPMLYRIDDVVIESWEAGANEDVLTDTFRTRVFMTVMLEPEWLATADFGFLPSAYALSCISEDNVDDIVRDSTRFRVNQPLVLQGDTLPAFTDIIDFGFFNQDIRNLSFLQPQWQVPVDFDLTLVDFPTADYQFQFRWVLQSGRVINRNFDIHIDLQ